jgi:peptidoglycan hydrolase CwlO-like protein
MKRDKWEKALVFIASLLGAVAVVTMMIYIRVQAAVPEPYPVYDSQNEQQQLTLDTIAAQLEAMQAEREEYNAEAMTFFEKVTLTLEKVDEYIGQITEFKDDLTSFLFWMIAIQALQLGVTIALIIATVWGN